MTREIWEQYWESRKSVFGKICELYRKIIISNSLSYYLDNYFPEKGIFLETGSGSTQTMKKFNKRNRTLIALDISEKALELSKNNPKIDAHVNADILKLPFKNNSIDGIWNLGVMEHFTEDELTIILSEFHRVLKKGSPAIMFWAPSFAPYRLFLSSIESIKKKKFFPDEPSLYKSKEKTRKLLNNFSSCECFYNARDLFTYAVVIAKK